MSAAAEITADHAWSGSRYIDVMNPQPEDIDPFEVATGLAREPRYGGACTAVFWSVAQHSLVCEQFARRDGIKDRDVLLAILLHDAPEYMLRDLIRPVKRNVPEYAKIETVWWTAIASRFGIPSEMPPEVKKYDDLALAAEKRELISPGCGDWPGVEKFPRYRIPGELLGLHIDAVRDSLLLRLRDFSQDAPGPGVPARARIPGFQEDDRP